MSAPNWCVTDLQSDGVLTLELAGRVFPVVQYVGSFAVNEIPTASCMLAVGRNTRSPGAAASSPAHRALLSVPRYAHAVVRFRPLGEATPTARWSGGSRVIFDGRFTGLGLRRASGKIYLVAHLTHWLVDLAGSSTLSADSHPSTPLQLTDPAVFEPVAGAAGASRLPVYLHEHVGYAVAHDAVKRDLWEAIKGLLCALANRKRTEPGCTTCGPSGTRNDLALAALRRIEGGGKACGKAPSAHHRPLALQTRGIEEVTDSVVDALQAQGVDSWAGMTFWDALVGGVFPLFNLVLLPRVDTAIVAADAPTIRASYRAIEPEDQDSFDLSGLIARPLAGVGVFARYDGRTGAALGESGEPCAGGCFTVPPVAGAPPGAMLYVGAPAWLTGVSAAEVPPPGTHHVETATTPAKKKAVKKSWVDQIGDLYRDYAQAVFVAQELRGRTGPLSGRLRFDLCPGSRVVVRSRPERFLGGADDLAIEMHGSINRVTIAVNAESGAASTAFQLTHLRTAWENAQDRASVAAHPLYGRDVFLGAPLVDGWGF